MEKELKQNAYDPHTRTLVYSRGQVYAFNQLNDFYRSWFGPPAAQKGLQRPYIRDPNEVRRLASYFSWAAWTTTATRPGTDYSYTNDWPSEPLAGNRPTAQAFLWSVLSLIALLGGVGLVLFLFGQFNLLGWHGYEEEEPNQQVEFRSPEEVEPTPVQRATPWYFLVVAGLFLAQGLFSSSKIPALAWIRRGFTA